MKASPGRRSLIRAAALGAAGLVAGPFAGPLAGRAWAAAAPPPLLGVYGDNDPKRVLAFERALGRKVDIITMFVGANASESDGVHTTQWCAGLDWPHPLLWTLRPFHMRQGSLAKANAGAYDSGWRQQARIIAHRQPSGPIFLRAFHELNGDWYAWSCIGREAEFVAAFRRLVGIFRAVSGRFRFEWNMNQGDYGGQPELAYPGDDVVDVIGMDFYFDTKWFGTDPLGAFTRMRDQKFGLRWLDEFAKRHGKPTGFPEWGVNTDLAAPYIRRVSEWFGDPGHNVLYHCYWESNNDIRGRLFGQYPNAAGAYRAEFGAAPA